MQLPGVARLSDYPSPE